MTLFNGMIAILLEEQDMMRHRNSQEHVQNNSFRAACETNFQAGVEKYEVLAIPTYEHALILSLAVSCDSVTLEDLMIKPDSKIANAEYRCYMRKKKPRSGFNGASLQQQPATASH